MTNPIRDALREAAIAAAEVPPFRNRDQAAAAVAAFHRKRAADLRAMGREYWPQAAVHTDMAAAVERAAKEGA